MRGTRKLLAAFAALTLLGAACGGDSDDAQDDAQGTSEPTGTALDVTATEYAFDAPDSIGGGTVNMTMNNAGQEPHFAGLARVSDGATYEDAVAAMTAPPSAAPPPLPPPFEEVAGIATVDPGGSSEVSFSLEEGTYVMFCFIPAPDGAPHAAKGMIQRLEVTESGGGGSLPEAQASVVGEDFAYPEATTDLSAGEVTVNFRNAGEQLHEINLIQLGDGGTMDDVVSWAADPQGPPPARFFGGVAVAPGAEGTATFTLEQGASYAFVCMIPDTRGDFQPHIAKGMFSETIST